MKAAIAITILSVTTSCGGGGGGGASPPADNGTGGNGTSTLLSHGTIPLSWGPLGNTIRELYIDAGSEVAFFNVYVQDPVDDPNLVYPAFPVSETVASSLYGGATSPVPPLKGSTFAYFQFNLAPNALVPASAQGYFLISGQYQAVVTDPFGIAPGRFVDCALYAGSTLIGSGSNAYIENSVDVIDGATTGPGFLCNTAVHGNSLTSAPAFKVSSIASGITYTIVYSLE